MDNMINKRFLVTCPLHGDDKLECKLLRVDLTVGGIYVALVIDKNHRILELELDSTTFEPLEEKEEEPPRTPGPLLPTAWSFNWSSWNEAQVRRNDNV